MTREELYKLIENGPVYLDEATGSNLMKAGMPVGVCPEEWITEHPNVILNLQKRYIEAGTQILYAPTFSGNRIKLTEYGLEDRMVEINTTLVRLCREAPGEQRSGLWKYYYDRSEPCSDGNHETGNTDRHLQGAGKNPV